jgi:predicted Zn-dependent peptidase
MNFTSSTLPNGVTLYVVPMKDNPAVTVLVAARTGSKYETKANNGISHFLEHMLFKGSTKRPSPKIISHELDAIGADFNAFTSEEYTGYYAKSNPQRLPLLVDILSDMYCHPLFDPKELEKEKGVIIEEIRMYQDMPHRHVHDVFMGTVYGDQPAGRNIAGTEATVQSFTQKDFFDYHRTHYTAGGTIVVVAGDVQFEQVQSLITNSFGALPAEQGPQKEMVSEQQQSPSLAVEYKKTDQEHLILGFRTIPASHADNDALEMLTTVLGRGMSSRLFTILREEMGVGYYVRADHEVYTDHGILTLSTGVDVKRIHEVLQALLRECRRLTKELVPDAELRKAKDYTTGTMMLGLETSDARTNFILSQYVMMQGKVLTPDALAQRFEKVSSADILRVAQKYIVPERMNLTCVGPVDRADIEKAFVLPA